MAKARKNRQFDNEAVTQDSNVEDLKQLEEKTTSGKSKAPSIGDSPLLRDSVLESSSLSLMPA